MKSTLLNTSSMTRYFFLLVVLCASQNVLAERCEPQENNEYEKILCQLKQNGHGAGLPNIFQFRENPPLVQALLLKKPAERAGITVEIPERDNQETLRRQEDLLLATPAAATAEPVHLNSAVTTVKIIQQAPAPVVTQPVAVTPTSTEPVRLGSAVKTISVVQQAPAMSAVPPAPALPAVVATTPVAPEPAPATEPVLAGKEIAINKEVFEPQVMDKSAASPLASCTLQQLTLGCAGGRYQLLGNKTNQQLPANALAEDHKLALPVYTGAADDTAAVDSYLAKAYDRYLAGMMEIGLGASTMSYTKFANLYHYIVEQHLDFSGRFETMYQFLKKDKAAIGVSTKLSVATGFTPQYCNELENFVACDYKGVNYVFTKVAVQEAQ